LRCQGRAGRRRQNRRGGVFSAGVHRSACAGARWTP
jgi:hypothetical protein